MSVGKQYHLGETYTLCTECGGPVIITSQTEARCMNCEVVFNIPAGTIQVIGSSAEDVVKVSLNLVSKIGLGDSQPATTLSQYPQYSIFISYRRCDTVSIAGRLLDRLVTRFGKEAVFMDVDSIPRGADFPAHIRTALEKARVVLALIGPFYQASTAPMFGGIDNIDYVRIEIETARLLGVRIMPILIGNTMPPVSAVLPEGMQFISTLNAARLDPGVDFESHVERLIADIEPYLS